MLDKIFKPLIAIFFLGLTNSAFPQLFIDSGQNLDIGTIFSVVLGDLDGNNDSDVVIVAYLSFTKIWLNN